MACRIGLIGLGRIAQAQHLPVIAANPAFELVAVADVSGAAPANVSGILRTTAELVHATDIEAVAVCTPPSVRYGIALAALAAGKHVLLEKPPVGTLGELVELEAAALAARRVIFATWHSQYNQAVDDTARRLAGQAVTRLLIEWKEDVRKSHPGQEWIFEPGGFGVFDPGINALSIVTRILPARLLVLGAADLVYPANADAPIGATLTFGRPDFRAEFDFRQEVGEVWEITFGTEAGHTFKISGNGRRLDVDGVTIVDEPPQEYERIYARFGQLIEQGRSDVDPAPLRLVADAYMIGRRTAAPSFHF